MRTPFEDLDAVAGPCFLSACLPSYALTYLPMRGTQLLDPERSAFCKCILYWCAIWAASLLFCCCWGRRQAMPWLAASMLPLCALRQATCFVCVPYLYLCVRPHAQRQRRANAAIAHYSMRHPLGFGTAKAVLALTSAVFGCYSTCATLPVWSLCVACGMRADVMNCRCALLQLCASAGSTTIVLSVMFLPRTWRQWLAASRSPGQRSSCVHASGARHLWLPVDAQLC